MNANERKSDVWYAAEPDGDSWPSRYPVPGRVRQYLCRLAISGDFWAEEAAEDYFHQHDGWEAHWPLVIALYDGPDGPELARYTVDREYCPEFYAARIEREDEK